jgi:general secretion pathway protein K
LININTAPKEVVAALDDRIDERMAERIMEERRLQPFKAPGDMHSVDGPIRSTLTGYISFKGTVFRLTAIAQVKDTARIVEAFVRTDGSPVILSWQEY